MLGRIDEALSVARDAMPTLRAADLQLPMLDYLALRAALAGAIDDAARIAGHADWAAGQHRFDRQHDTKPVIDRLDALLAASLADDRRRALAAEGAALAEDAVIALALA
jgi:hypothetical protein